MRGEVHSCSLFSTAEFASASGALTRLLEVERTSYDELGVSGMSATLDSKLAAALSKTIIWELVRHINLKKEQAVRKEQYLKGAADLVAVVRPS